MSECRFCQTSNLSSNFCQNCGASFCSDCLNDEKIDTYICHDCKSKNIEILDDEETKICKDCESKNAIKLIQHIKTCPKCNSHLIINIYEKKEELEQKFLELIKSSRSFVEPFRDLINKLYLLRQKVKQARDPPIKCYHFPKMESNLLALFKLFFYVEENLLDKIKTHFQHLAFNKEYFFDIYAQPISNINIIEGILENQYRSFNSIQEYILKNVDGIAKSIEKIQKNLTFIDRITDLFNLHKRFLNLTDDEKPVFAINAKLTNGLNSHDRLKKNKGVLFITNLDLSFIQEYGVIKKKQELIFKAPVGEIIRIKEKGKVFKKLYIEFVYGKYEFTLPSKAISKVIEYILLARNFDDTTIFDFESARKLLELELDLKKLKHFIEENINSFFSIKCQYNKNINEYQKPKQENNQNYYESYPSEKYLHQRNENSYNNQESSNNLVCRNHIRTYVPQSREHRYSRQTINSRSPPPEPYNFPRGSHRRQPPLNYEEEGFYFQNLYNPERFQNYDPQNYENRYDQPVEDLDEKNILMKKLEKVQKFGQQIPNQINKIIYDLQQMNAPNHTPQHLNRRSRYQDYSRNHLSEFFNTDTNSISRKKPYSYADEFLKNFHGDEDENYKKLLELKKERFSLKETLKKLEKKFDEGIISETDYFRTFKNLKKDIYMTDKKIEKVKEKLKEEDSIRRIGRSFDSNKYFS
jgi:hypothetical protein